MANLTLSLDDSLLQQAREAALAEHTSVNAMVRDFLTRYVGSKQRRLEALDTLDAIAARSASRSDQIWLREDLHER
jgi:plasmid stability protein